jgi:hypothetical protein
MQVWLVAMVIEVIRITLVIANSLFDSPDLAIALRPPMTSHCDRASSPQVAWLVGSRTIWGATRGLRAMELFVSLDFRERAG